MDDAQIYDAALRTARRIVAEASIHSCHPGIYMARVAGAMIALVGHMDCDDAAKAAARGIRGAMDDIIASIEAEGGSPQ